MCKWLSLSHIAKIHIILIKQTIFSNKMKKKGDQVSDLLCPKLSELLYNLGKIVNKPLEQALAKAFEPFSVNGCIMSAI